MSEWFVQYQGGKGYIPAREISDTEYETFGGYVKDRGVCEQTVNGLNGGMWKNARTEKHTRSV